MAESENNGADGNFGCDCIGDRDEGDGTSRGALLSRPETDVAKKREDVKE